MRGPAGPADEVDVLAFDIFGTTVDWRTGVAAQIDRIMAARGVDVDAGDMADAWRGRYLPSMERVNSGACQWAHLDVLHRESLDELLDVFAVSHRCDESVRDALVRSWHRLPAWPDVAEGLRRLRERYVVIALSNGGFALLTRLLKAEGLAFDAIVSAQNARAYKPDPRAYRTAAELLDVPPHRMLMVAAHAWDVAGAARAGLRTAFLERPTEKGPHRAADRAADADTGLSVRSVTELATALGC